jgi:hypothetical protein
VSCLWGAPRGRGGLGVEGVLHEREGEKGKAKRKTRKTHERGPTWKAAAPKDPFCLPMLCA